MLLLERNYVSASYVYIIVISFQTHSYCQLSYHSKWGWIWDDITSITFFKYILLIMLLQLSHFPLFIPLRPMHILPPVFPHFSSCPWVIYVSSLASAFPILFLPSLSTFYLPFMLLILCTFSPFLPTHSPADCLPCDLHFCDFVPVLVVCLVFVFVFLFFRFICW